MAAQIHKVGFFLTPLLNAMLLLQFCLATHMVLLCSLQRRKRMSILLMLNKIRVLQKRSFWIRPGKSSLWWGNFITNKVTVEEWKTNFHLNHNTFNMLCGELQPFIQQRVTRMWLPLSVEKQVVITLYYLADKGRMQKVSNAFGIRKCTVSDVVK